MIAGDLQTGAQIAVLQLRLDRAHAGRESIGKVGEMLFAGFAGQRQQGLADQGHLFWGFGVLELYGFEIAGAQTGVEPLEIDLGVLIFLFEGGQGTGIKLGRRFELEEDGIASSGKLGGGLQRVFVSDLIKPHGGMGQSQAPVIGMGGEGGFEGVECRGVAAENFGLNVFIGAVRFGILLDFGRAPDRAEIGPHRLHERGQGRGIHALERAENRLHGLQAVDFGLRVGFDKGVSQGGLVERSDGQGPQAFDPASEFLQVPVLTRAGQRNAVGLWIVSIGIHETVGLALGGIRVVFFRPDFKKPAS